MLQLDLDVRERIANCGCYIPKPTPPIDQAEAHFKAAGRPHYGSGKTLLSLAALEVSVQIQLSHSERWISDHLPVKLKLLALLADVFTLKLRQSRHCSNPSHSA